MKTLNVSKVAKASLLTLFVALVPLIVPAAAQNTNGANTGQTTTTQPNTNINRPAETPRTEPTLRAEPTLRTEPTPRTIVRQEERGIDIPWGLLGLAGLLGLLHRPKRVVERVEVHDTKRVEVHDTTNQRTEPTNPRNEPRR